MDAFGVKLIQLFTTPYWREELIDQLYESHEVRKEVGNFQYDAKSGDMHYFSFLDSDLVKLRSVRNHILKLSVPEKEPEWSEKKEVKELHVYADEDHVHMQKPDKQKEKKGKKKK